MKTSRFIPALVAVSLLMLPVVAAAAGMPFGLGIKAGVSASTLKGSYADFINAKSQPGYVVGVYLYQDFTPYFGLQEEGLWRAVRSKGDNDIKINLQYVEVPVLLRFYLLPSPVKPFIYAGPSWDFRVTGKLVGPGGDVDIKDHLRTVNTSVAVGAGVRFDLGGLGAVADARYLASTQGIVKSGDVIVIEEPSDVRVNTWTLSVGVQF